MALIKFGMMMTDARGKLGGHVFTKARNGATVRTKVTPVNPQTTAQSASRAVFAAMSQAWRGLTESERLSWNAAVGDYSKTNIFGDSYLPSGKNLFVGLNCNLRNVGATAIDAPALPVTVEPLLLSSVDVSNAGESITLSLVGTEPASGFIKVIEATAPFSPGRYNFSGQFAKISSWITTPVDNPDALYQHYLEKYGAAEVGQKIAFRSYTVVVATGQKSPYSQVTTIVIA